MRCVAPAGPRSGDGYSIGYPEGWHVNTPEIVAPCSLFDSEPLEVPMDSEIPIEIAITIGIESVPYDTMTGDVMGRRDLSRERTRIDGREAMRVRAETTGEGLYDAGIGSYHYSVDLGEETLIATTFDAGPLPFDRKRAVLDAMMSSLRFGEPGGG